MLASVHIYPLKGCRAVDLDQAVVEPWGLAGDRRWLLVDADGQFLTQREHPALARLVVSYGAGRGHRRVRATAARRCRWPPRAGARSCSR